MWFGLSEPSTSLPALSLSKCCPNRSRTLTYQALQEFSGRFPGHNPMSLGRVVYINYFLSHSPFGIPDWSIMPFNVLGLIVLDP